MNEQLGVVDALTLRSWRLLNAVWRPVVVVVLAVIVQLAVDAVVSITLNTSGITDLTFSPTALELGCNRSVPFGEGVCFHPISNSIVKLVFRILLSIGIGLLIGAFLVRRAQPRPMTAVGLAAAVYTAIGIGLVESHSDGLIRGLSVASRTPVLQTLGYELAIALTILVAMWWAHGKEAAIPTHS